MRWSSTEMNQLKDMKPPDRSASTSEHQESERSHIILAEGWAGRDGRLAGPSGLHGRIPGGRPPGLAPPQPYRSARRPRWAAGAPDREPVTTPRVRETSRPPS